VIKCNRCAGGSWLRSVLGGISKKDELPPGEDGKRREVFGAAHSHFERPATAAELETPPADGGDAVSSPATAGEQPPPSMAGEGDLLKDPLRQNSEAQA